VEVFTACILYVLLWWFSLFLVLPFGTKPVAAPDKVTGWRGAPEAPHLLRKLVATTLLSALLWAGLMVVILHRDWLSFRQGWLAMPDDS
jgi:predicted secreted protein